MYIMVYRRNTIKCFSIHPCKYFLENLLQMVFGLLKHISSNNVAMIHTDLSGLGCILRGPVLSLSIINRTIMMCGLENLLIFLEARKNK